jgi:aminopeptidase N
MRSLLLAAAMAAAPVPGAPGIGDRLFPKLGNGGYDVQHYDIDLNYATAAPAQGIDGTVTITAKATQALSRFDLDFAGDGVGSVSVDGAPATFSRSGEKLIITPASSLAKGTTFTATVSSFTAHPTAPSTSNFTRDAFIVTPDGSATFPQPAGAHRFLPSNDHPSDKATFTFHLDVPAGETAVANGDLESQATAGGRTVYVYDAKQPMATELIQLAVGDYQLIDRGAQNGVHVRDVVSPTLAPELAGQLPVELEQLSWLEARLGPYPFAGYGSFVIDTSIGASLETQTLSTYDKTVFETPTGPIAGPEIGSLATTTMLHELAHQWFGDSVSPRDWTDVWLNEGHATWYEWTYGVAHPADLLAATRGIEGGLDGVAKYEYGFADFSRHNAGPVARPKGASFQKLFSSQVYTGGALVLYALRQKVGNAKFEKIEREWVTKYAGRSVSTADYIALASRIGGKSAGPFLHDWLYGTRTPQMPGHPDWKVKTIKQVEGR